MRALMVEAPKLGARLWRNNVGSGLMVRGKSPQHRESIIAECQAIAVRMGGSASRITFGLPTGSGDLIGYVGYTVTPADVGSVIPKFASVEVKTARGRSSDEQKAWHRFVISVGGASGEVRSVDELRALIGHTGPESN